MVIAHFITGVLEQELMVSGIESLVIAAAFEPHAKVKTLRGSLRGVVSRVLEDGRVVWRPNGRAAELVALPETLVLDKARGQGA